MTKLAWVMVALLVLVIAGVGVFTATQSNAPPTGIFDPNCGVWCPEGTTCQRVLRNVDEFTPDGVRGRDVYGCR